MTPTYLNIRLCFRATVSLETGKEHEMLLNRHVLIENVVLGTESDALSDLYQILANVVSVNVRRAAARL